MKKKALPLILLFSLVFSGFAVPTLAHCPLCTAAAAGAVTITRAYGLDDIIVGTFIGAFTVSTALWLHNILLKRNHGKNYIRYQNYIIFILSVVPTIISFYFIGLSSDAFYKIYNIDKVTIGLTAGSAITGLAFVSHGILRKMNANRNIVPAQAILLSLFFILIANLIFYGIGWVKV